MGKIQIMVLTSPNGQDDVCKANIAMCHSFLVDEEEGMSRS
jgi:hypothetical protein